jgi:mannobiose 2-epimerase
LADEVDQMLRRHVLDPWFPRAVDPHGGFHQIYRRNWTRVADSTRTVVYQARLTWMAAEAHARFPGQDYGHFAEHGLRFLERFLDRREGGVVWRLGFQEKHTYGQAFAIHAGAAVYRRTGDPSALGLARQVYAWLDASAYDTEHGGYHEGGDALGTPAGCKSMNTHLHVVEAMTALLQVWPDPRLHQRLSELFELFRDRIVVESVGCLNGCFTRDWRSLPGPSAFGHDLESAFLMLEASRVLQRADHGRTQALARTITDRAVAFGHDQFYGGFYEFGHGSRQKIFWVQAEALHTLLLVRGYDELFMDQWDFVRRCQVDARHGGWHACVSRSGWPRWGQRKSDRWIDPYHQGRALLAVSALLCS